MNDKQIKQIAKTICQKVNERIKMIDYLPEKYQCGIESFGDSYRIWVKFDNIVFLRFCPYISSIDKNKQILSMLFVYAVDDSSWYNSLLTGVDISVNEKMKSNNMETFEEILEKRLPLGKDKEKACIIKVLEENNIEYSKITYDTINCRYVVESKLSLPEKQINDRNCIVYKYMSLETFKKILDNRKIRLNSIVSMNDTSEAFFLGDYVCDAYQDNYRFRLELNYSPEDKNGKRYSTLLKYKNYLIGSFSSKVDDPILWERYGNNYKGICIGFNSFSQKLRSIIYSGNKTDVFEKLKGISTQLRQQGIPLYFDFIGIEQFFVKHWQFEAESEYRLLEKMKDDDLEFTLYGDLLAYYHEFDFMDLGLKPVSLWFGANCPNKDVNIPLLTDLAIRKLGISEVYISKCNKYRI